MATTTIDRLNGINSGVAIKAPCRAATTVAITLSAEQTVDGIALVAGDRVLVKNQTSSIDNGIYEVATSGWQRTLDFDGSNDVVTGTVVYVNFGTLNANKAYQVSTTGIITPGTSSCAWTQSSNLTTVNVSAYMQTLLDDADAATAQTTLGGTTTGKALFTAASASAARTAIGTVIGTDVQAYDADLAAIAGLTSAASKIPYFTGASAAALATFIPTATSWTPSLLLGGGNTGMVGSYSGLGFAFGDMRVLMGFITLTALGSSTGSASITGFHTAFGTPSGNRPGMLVLRSGGTSWPNNAFIETSGTSLLLRASGASALSDITQSSMSATTQFSFMIIYGV